MVRSLVAGCALILCVVTVAAQENAVEERSALMKTQGNYTYRVLNGMVRGQAPYDQAKVDDAFAKLAETAAKLPSIFPESSKGKVAANSNYYASDKVWENKADVEARIAKLAKDVADLRAKVRSLDSLKAAYPTLNQNCNDCHRQYRARKS